MLYTMDKAGIIALVIQVVLPLIVGLVTRRMTHPGVKAVLLLALTAVTQLFTQWLDAINTSAVWDWKTVVWGIVLGFVISVVTHFGLWKPTTVAAAAQNSGVK